LRDDDEPVPPNSPSDDDCRRSLRLKQRFSTDSDLNFYSIKQHPLRRPFSHSPRRVAATADDDVRAQHEPGQHRSGRAQNALDQRGLRRRRGHRRRRRNARGRRPVVARVATAAAAAAMIRRLSGTRSTAAAAVVVVVIVRPETSVRGHARRRTVVVVCTRSSTEQTNTKTS